MYCVFFNDISNDNESFIQETFNVCVGDDDEVKNKLYLNLVVNFTTFLWTSFAPAMITIWTF